MKKPSFYTSEAKINLLIVLLSCLGAIATEQVTIFLRTEGLSEKHAACFSCLHTGSELGVVYLESGFLSVVSPEVWERTDRIHGSPLRLPTLPLRAWLSQSVREGRVPSDGVSPAFTLTALPQPPLLTSLAMPSSEWQAFSLSAVGRLGRHAPHLLFETVLSTSPLSSSPPTPFTPEARISLTHS